MDKHYDFAGWATKADMRCSDGRLIAKDAFAHQDGTKVPIVWNHMSGEKRWCASLQRSRPK